MGSSDVSDLGRTEAIGSNVLAAMLRLYTDCIRLGKGAAMKAAGSARRAPERPSSSSTISKGKTHLLILLCAILLGK